MPGRMAASMNKVIIIAGPTASGKTELAIQLAKRYNTSIISADSRQCYREMTIGTAKPSEEKLEEVPHYFINTHSVHDRVTASDFEQYALEKLEEIFTARDTAVVCGGTGLYIKALCEGLDPMPEVPLETTIAIESDYSDKGISWLQERVAEEDPFFYASAEIQNPARLIRALGFVRTTGKSIIEFRSGIKKERSFSIKKLCLSVPREVLYQRIDRRVEEMMQHGLLEEVRSLFPFKDLPALQTVGYSELFDFLEKRTSLERAVSLIKQHTRNYAKRQETWFRKDMEFERLDNSQGEPITQILLQ